MVVDGGVYCRWDGSNAALLFVRALLEVSPLEFCVTVVVVGDDDDPMLPLLLSTSSVVEASKDE